MGKNKKTGENTVKNSVHKKKNSDESMYDAVEKTGEKYHDVYAYKYMGTTVNYKRFLKQITDCAKALKALGVRRGDRVTICLPDIPQAVIMFYAINAIGAVSCLIHPLSAENEINFYLTDSKSSVCIALDDNLGRFSSAWETTRLKKLIVTRASEMMSFSHKLVYRISEIRSFEYSSAGENNIIYWSDFLASGNTANDFSAEKCGSDELACILYSGGTTGQTKGVLLSNRNFNALSRQIISGMTDFKAGDIILSAVPYFKGLGLGFCVHTVLSNGGCCIILPDYEPQRYAKYLMRSKPEYIVGLPNLFDNLLRLPMLDGADLSQLKGIFCSGDHLPKELKKRFEYFLRDHNCNVTVREGYGTTECIALCCLTPEKNPKEGSIGIPLPDMLCKIVKPGTINPCGTGVEGEICISGPTVMSGYLGRKDETADTLKRHKDNKLWLHTGDLGMIDSEGYLFFRHRIKRLIISYGYSIYASQVEKILCNNNSVKKCAVIGIPDKKARQLVKAFIVLKDSSNNNDETKKKIIDYCKANLTKYATPKEIEFIESLPVTISGSVDYRELERREALAREEKEGAERFGKN
ncbi:MAG: class I adenylate-forming enzyme family protein [Acutalibacteraceae bacterium]|nr:acyl--CoA ligase [Clostridia bacterium]MEE3449402.1 class I adenylate-forming enzyme family protein [Acutalibacteraceae bacterium]